MKSIAPFTTRPSVAKFSSVVGVVVEDNETSAIVLRLLNSLLTYSQYMHHHFSDIAIYSSVPSYNSVFVVSMTHSTACERGI